MLINDKANPDIRESLSQGILAFQHKNDKFDLLLRKVILSRNNDRRGLYFMSFTFGSMAGTSFLLYVEL